MNVKFQFMAILRQHRKNKKVQSLDVTSNKQNGTISHTDNGCTSVQKDSNIKDERIITSGGVPKNGKNLHLTISKGVGVFLISYILKIKS